MLFSFNRGCIGTVLVYNIWTSNLGTDLKLCVSAIYAIGLFWIYIIIGLTLKRFRELDVKLVQPLRSLSDVIKWLKRRVYLLIIVIAVWAFVVPLVLTQGLGFRANLLKVSDFVLV